MLWNSQEAHHKEVTEFSTHLSVSLTEVSLQTPSKNPSSVQHWSSCTIQPRRRVWKISPVHDSYLSMWLVSTKGGSKFSALLLCSRSKPCSSGQESQTGAAPRLCGQTSRMGKSGWLHIWGEELLPCTQVGKTIPFISGYIVCH